MYLTAVYEIKNADKKCHKKRVKRRESAWLGNAGDGGRTLCPHTANTGSSRCRCRPTYRPTRMEHMSLFVNLPSPKPDKFTII